MHRVVRSADLNGDRSNSWRSSPVVALVVIALFFAVQLALPSSRLGDPAASRFGWQMFSTYQEEIEFTVNTAEGSRVVDLRELTAQFRVELPLDELVPDHLCRTVPGAISVTVDGEEHRC